MDQERFAALTRAVAQRTDRRGVFGIAGAVAAMVTGIARQPDEAAALAGFCRIATAKCSRNTQCCSLRCKAGACTCARNGSDCFQIGINCCSGKCKKGKCRR